MKITPSHCLYAVLASLAMSGCSSHSNNPTPSASTGPAPGATADAAQRQAMIAQRTSAARSKGISGMKPGHTLTVDSYRTMMDHMTAEQKIEFAHKHPNIGSMLPPPPQH